MLKLAQIDSIKTVRRKILDPKGFTLLEVLVVVGIIGVMFVVATQIFINTIRGANKANITNEARENASLVSESLQRDVHISTSVAVSTTNVTNDTISLQVPTTYVSTGSIVWLCNLPSGSNGYITRNGLTVTNKDPQNGVNVNSCSFTPANGGVGTLVTLDLQMVQGTSAGSTQDLQALVQQRVVAQTRGY